MDTGRTVRRVPEQVQIRKEMDMLLRLCLQLVVLESFTSYQARHAKAKKTSIV